MKSSILLPLFAAVLLGSAGGAMAVEPDRAQEPVRLSALQMDSVSAGQTSEAGGWASVLQGTAYSSSGSNTLSYGTVTHTSASSLNVARGEGAETGAWARSFF